MRQSNAISQPTLLCFQRIPSIGRGTTSNFSTDVWINDYEDVIKLQKAIKQKERVVSTTSRLRFRHNMLNTPNRIPNKKAIPPSRIPILSSRVLKATVSNPAAAVSTTITATQTTTINEVTSGKIRLDEKIKGKCKSLSTTYFSQGHYPHLQQGTVVNRVKKCAVCQENNKTPNLHRKQQKQQQKQKQNHYQHLLYQAFRLVTTFNCSSLSIYSCCPE